MPLMPKQDWSRPGIRKKISRDLLLVQLVGILIFKYLRPFRTYCWLAMRYIRCRLLALLSTIFLLPFTIAQSDGGAQPIDTTALHAQIDTLIKHQQWDASLPLIFTALEEERQQQDWRGYEDMADNMAYALFNLRRTDSSLVLISQTLSTLREAGQDSTVNTARLWGYLATNYVRAERFMEALESQQKAIGILERKKYLGDKLAYAYKNAAQALVRFDNHTLARQYFEASIRVDTAGTYRAAIYAQLANQSHFRDDEASVMRYYLLGMAEPRKSEHDIAHLSANGASAFITAGRYAEAKAMLRTAWAFFDKKPDHWINNRMRVMSQLANIATLEHQPQTALAYYRQAETNGKTYLPRKSREMAKLYNDWAKYWEHKQQPDSALACYQKALVQAFPNFQSLSILDNPSLSEAWAESQAMIAARGKAMLLSSLPQPSVQTDRAAFESFELSFLVADRMRRTYGNDADKMVMADQLRPAVNAAVHHLCRTYAAAHNPADLVALFYLLEQTRANALSDALRQQRALALSGIPDTLLNQEEKQRRELAFLDQNYRMAADSASKARFQDKWVKKELTYAHLLKNMGEQYPQFRQYQQADRAVDISEIAANMPDSAILLTWHDAGDRYVCLSMHHQGHLALREVPRDSVLDGQLYHLITLLNDKAAQETHPETLLDLSQALGEKLLPLSLLSDARAIIVVPDGRLCQLPFEVLLTRPHTGVLSKAPYLLRSHTLRYTWSASLLASHPSTGQKVRGALHYAPFVRKTRDGLPILSHSLRDMPPTLHAELRQGEAASVADFLEKSPYYAILHLSTHASASQPEPGIEFYDRRLLRSDIYAQRLHTDLVSLSACETGSGELASSEGVLSLARAFAYAGAKSMVASLWAVNESSTADLFSAFYEHLDKGLSKSEALQQAKLRYLDGSEMEARKLPFYWAALTLSGDDGQVDISPRTDGRLWWTLAVVATLGLAATLYRRRKKT